MKLKLLVITTLLYNCIWAGTIGSDTAVTRFNASQTLNNGDRVAGFAALAGGFSLASPSVEATFDSFFPVSGAIDLNFGTLNLNQDLILNDVSTITTLGNIVGNGHNFQLPSVADFVPSSGPVALACGVSLLTTFPATGAELAEQVNTIDWNANDAYLVIAMNYLNTTDNIISVFSWTPATNAITYITGVPGTTSVTSLTSVRWHPVSNWLGIARLVGAGNELFTYSFNGATLAVISSLATTTSPVDLAWFPTTGAFLAVAFSTTGAQLAIYPADTGTGALSAISATADTTVNAQKVSWNSDGTYLAVGTAFNSGGSELLIYSVSGATPTLTLDASFNIGTGIFALSWDQGSTNTNLIAVGTQTGANDLLLFSHSTGNLTQIPVNVPEIINTTSVYWASNGACLSVSMVNNIAVAALQQYNYNNGILTQNNALNLGVTVNDVRWSRSGNYLATADDAPEIQVYELLSTLADTNTVFFWDTNIVLTGDVTFTDVILTFSGQNNSIIGRGNVLSFTPTFSLQVSDGGSLLMQNVTINGIEANNIMGLSDLTTFSFQDVTLVLSGNYTFSHGKLDILKDLTISGPNQSFIYTSPIASVIRGGQFGTADGSPIYYGSLTIDDSVTFSYAPLNNSLNLLTFESAYSKIILNSGMLLATNLNLINGSLQINGNSTINGTTSIVLGNGIQTNNMAIEVFPAADLQLLGKIFYSNV